MEEKKAKENCLERMKQIDADRKIADFITKQKQDYDFKRKYAQIRAQEFAGECEARGLMASEGGRRQKSLMINGCNYFGKSAIRSAPFAIFSRQDLLKLVLEMDELWKTEWKEEFYQKGIKEGYIKEGWEMPKSIVPEIYGEIQTNENGELYTTKAQRTGCSMCGFGIHLEKRPHRFDQLKERNPKEWHFWMYECCEDEDGNKYGWAKVLDYIGVGY